VFSAEPQHETLSSQWRMMDRKAAMKGRKQERALSAHLLHAMVVEAAGVELEPLCGRPSPQAKS